MDDDDDDGDEGVPVPTVPLLLQGSGQARVRGCAGQA